jgi:Fe-S cluster biogenesis protein NfuA
MLRRPIDTASGTSPATLTGRIQAKLDGRVRPMLQIHGGDIELVNSSPDSVVVRFHGACIGCPLRPLTIAALVEPAIREVAGSATVDSGTRVSAAAARRLAKLAASSRDAASHIHPALVASAEHAQHCSGKE